MTQSETEKAENSDTLNPQPVMQQGTPEDVDSRSDREARAYRFLDGLGIQFGRIDHPDKLLNVRICKNLFLCNRQKTDFYLLVMPADKPFKTKELSGQLGISRLSFADEEAMGKLLDVHPGSVSVLALMNDKEHKVRLLIDGDVLKQEIFGCHPCENSTSIRFPTKDLTEKVLPALGAKPVIVKLTGEE